MEHIFNIDNKLSISEIEASLKDQVGVFSLKKIILRNKEDAVEYLNDIKRDGVLFGVRYEVRESNFIASPKYKELHDKVLETEGEIENFAIHVFERFKEQKISKKSCDECSSSISRSHYIDNIEKILAEQEIKSITKNELICPVCKNESFIITEGDERKSDGLKERLIKQHDKLSEAEAIFNSKNGTLVTKVIVLDEAVNYSSDEAEVIIDSSADEMFPDVAPEVVESISHANIENAESEEEAVELSEDSSINEEANKDSDDIVIAEENIEKLGENEEFEDMFSDDNEQDDDGPDISDEEQEVVEVKKPFVWGH